TFANYYESLTPAEKLIYGRLGFFDIYHIWYFNLLLLLLSLNIILSSIDYFPRAWNSIRRKKLTASPTFAQSQRVRVEPVEMKDLSHSDLVERARQAVRALRYKVKVTDEEVQGKTRTTVYAEKGAWNRLGAYYIHIALLTIFAGGFISATRSNTGGMWLAPGMVDDKLMMNTFEVNNETNEYAIGQRAFQLPFVIECIDIQQKLIDKTKYIDGGNTLDWLTRVRIKDNETGQTQEALIHLNKPYDYRGYRMFQASFRDIGSARTVNLRVKSESGATQDVALKLNEEAKLADGTILRYVEFNPTFTLNQQGEPDIGSNQYENPAAHLEVTKPNGENGSIWAFNENFQKQLESEPAWKARLISSTGPQVTLVDFEKASQAHMLSIQYNPGITTIYIGSFLLCLMLVLTFFFSHQKLWVVVEGGRVFIGGDANRNRLGFEDRMKKIAARIRGEAPQAE
ncbi:MAG TPA: cytochrome c biogenesis protein ResB, partial [Blastocatellia bacterium]|nr:cytochrome c biogenesis protein ResB [Blastocatellia bacterium]